MTRILLVDNSNLQREFLKVIISDHLGDANIVEADDLKSAFAQITGSPDLEIAIIDLSLSHDTAQQEGLRILQKLAEERPRCHRVLVTSKMEDWDIKDRSLADSFISIHRENEDRISQLQSALDEALQLT